MQKKYVLDTNILIQSPNSIYGFEDNEVIVTGTTLQELDRKKTAAGELGYNAREAIRIIDRFREQGDYLKGIPMENGGTFKIEPNGIKDNLPQGYDLSQADNRIISAVITLTENSDVPVILITNDISMRVNASVCKVAVQGYENETVGTQVVYTGRRELYLSDTLIDKLHAERKIPYEGTDGEPLTENEYLQILSFEDDSKSALGIWKNGYIYRINADSLTGMGGIKGKNVAQRFMMHALLAPSEEIPLLIAKGPAGTGKTMLAIACGLAQTYDSRSERKYNSVLITRTNTLSDSDLGFLPGTLEEKMEPLIAPFKDNMELIFAGKEKDVETAKQQIEYVIGKEIVKICSVAYMRGRSLSDTYLIVDEAQNMTVNQVLEIISRAGNGTKIVLCGDPDQIDNPKLDRRNNGLVFAAEKMKGSKLCAQVTFEQEESVRSPLAMEAAKRLTIIS